MQLSVFKLNAWPTAFVDINGRLESAADCLVVAQKLQQLAGVLRAWEAEATAARSSESRIVPSVQTPSEPTAPPKRSSKGSKNGTEKKRLRPSGTRAV